jgi:hypothetical protein
MVRELAAVGCELERLRALIAERLPAPVEDGDVIASSRLPSKL